MKQWRLLIIGFWIFVGGMLAWQIYNNNQQAATYAESHPDQHWFYNPAALSPQPPKAPAPDVGQVNYQIIPDSPVQGNFTIRFMVKNVGNVAATAIQVKVRPYRGMMNSTEDGGHAHVINPNPGGSATSQTGGIGPLSDTDPVSQYGQWVSLPDLAPGQTADESSVFFYEPGKTPNPGAQLEITFEPAAAK